MAFVRLSLNCIVIIIVWVDHFGLSDTDVCHLTANLSKTVSRSVTGQLELNISSTRAV